MESSLIKIGTVLVLFFMLILSCKKENVEPTPIQVKKPAISTQINPIGSIRSLSTNDIRDGNGVTDIDGNTYKTMIIGNQEWMIENLRVTKYSDGDTIPCFNEIGYDTSRINNSDEIWWNLKTGAYSYYNCDTSYKYNGALYNDFAVLRGIAPDGWHVASVADFKILSDYCDSTNATFNTITFSGLMRVGGFSYNSNYNHWWTSDPGMGCAMPYSYDPQNPDFKPYSFTCFGNEASIGIGVTCVKNN